MSQWWPQMRYSLSLPTRGSKPETPLGNGIINADITSPYSNLAFIGTMQQGSQLLRGEIRISKRAELQPLTLQIQLDSLTNNSGNGHPFPLNYRRFLEWSPDGQWWNSAPEWPQ